MPTGYGYVLPDQNGWSRYLHFQAAWVVVLTGLLYAVYGLLTRHFRRNLVPAAAGAKADIRLPVGVTTAVVEARLRDWLGAIDGVTWRVTRRYEPRYTDPDHAIVRCVSDAAHEVLGARPVVNMRVGGSDARLYRMDGIPSVVFGCTPFNMGGPDENILVEELVAVATVHALTAFDYDGNKRWQRDLPHELMNYEGPSRQLQNTLDGELPRMIAHLERKIAALETYAQTPPP